MCPYGKHKQWKCGRLQLECVCMATTININSESVAGINIVPYKCNNNAQLKHKLFSTRKRHNLSNHNLSNVANKESVG